MKKRPVRQTLLCLLLIACTLFTLCACPANTPGGDDPNDPGNQTPPEDENVIYGNGTLIAGAGDTLAADAAVLTPATYDESVAKDLPAGNFFRVFEQYLQSGSVLRATNGTANLTSNSAKNRSYNGKGAVLLMPEGMAVRGAENLTLSNLVIVGNVKISDSTSVIFENVEIRGTVTIEQGSTGVVLNACRLTADNAVINAGSNVTVMNSYIGFTACGVSDTGAGLTVQNCRLAGTGMAVNAAASDTAVKYNTISLTETDTGIAFGEDAVNAIAAMNVITGAQKSVAVNGARNAVVVRNSLISVEATGNRNLYICDNEMGGRLTAKNNNYFLADNNTYPADSKNHSPILADNENTNGDTLTKVDERLEVGADEALLPHVDKYQFIGMERKATVKDVTAQNQLSIVNYVAKYAAAGDAVIVAPGVYKTNLPISFGASHAGTTLYAYGVYVERTEVAKTNSIGSLLTCEQTANVTVKGLTVGYEQPSVKQVYVIAKNEKSLTLDVLPGAGMIPEFGDTNAEYYLNKTMYLHPKDNGYKPIGDIEFTNVTKRQGGIIRITVESESDFDVIKIGDALTNRYPSYSRTVYTARSKNITYQDLTVFGIAGAFCCYEEENESATTYYRMADTTRVGELISKSEYETYEGYETDHGIDFEISRVDGRYYGSVPHVGSIDGIQADRCAKGSQVISCLFENMCDDGSLQKGRHARLAKITVNDDGTATIIFKGNHAGNRGTNVEPNGFCADIKQGDRVSVYTAKGQLICDSIAQNNAEYFDTVKSTYNNQNMKRYKVTVLAKDLNPEWASILSDYTRDAEGYLTEDSQSSAEKILVDNMSRSCNGFLFDNVMVRNTRSRGFLIKASNGTIKNCTIRDNAKLAIAVIYEIYWGESGYSENVLIEKNLIDHVGYALHNNGQYLHYPINISGLGGGTVDEDFLLYQNIRIVGNKFVNPVNEYWIYVQAAKGVVIEDNDFGSFAEEDEWHHAKVLLLNGAANITLSHNRFSPYVMHQFLVEGEHYKDINGTDVMLGDIPLIPNNP